MNVQVLQHVPFEDIGCMAGWLADRKARLTYTRFFADPRLPKPDDLDLIIVMGGPMSVNDETAFPWLVAEKDFLREVLRRGIPVLGICLGAQLIASALGARISPNRHKEIGWFPVTGISGCDGVFRFPEAVEVFHWHGETFDLPVGGQLLASSRGCRHQAFQVGRNVLGLQFHLETTPESLDALIVNSRDELVKGLYIQDEPTLRAAPAAAFSRVNRLMDEVLSYVTR